MMDPFNYQIQTAQVGLHKRLESTVQKHLAHVFLQPIPVLQADIFQTLSTTLSAIDRPLILDSGCGRGESSYHLAKQFPDHVVIGLDKSQHRLKEGAAFLQDKACSNLVMVQADCVSFWQLCHNAGLSFARHYMLYPNPWPKAKHLKRRWHGHPIFPTLMQLSPYLELRSNWRIYLEEFAYAASMLDCTAQLTAYAPSALMTAFERKYAQNNVDLFQLIVQQ